jgi:hypothetical protein
MSKGMRLPQSVHANNLNEKHIEKRLPSGRANDDFYANKFLTAFAAAEDDDWWYTDVHSDDDW